MRILAINVRVWAQRERERVALCARSCACSSMGFLFAIWQYGQCISVQLASRVWTCPSRHYSLVRVVFGAASWQTQGIVAGLFSGIQNAWRYKSVCLVPPLRNECNATECEEDTAEDSVGFKLECGRSWLVTFAWLRR